MKDFKLDVEQDEGFTTISCTGQVDSEVIDELDTSITRLCKEASQNVVIDLMDLGYVFSKTISNFVKYYKILKRKKLQLVFINTSKTVKEVLEASKLTRIIPVFNNINEFLDWSHQSSSSEKASTIYDIKIRDNVEIISFKISNDDLGFQHIGKALSEAADKIKSNKVILDLKNISTINSVSVASLIELGKIVTSRKGKLVLSGVNELTRELLRILNISNLFILTENIDDGIETLTKSN